MSNTNKTNEKVVDLEEVREEKAAEVVVEEKKGFLSGIGAGIKKHWKPIVGGIALFCAGFLVAGLAGAGDEDDEESDEIWVDDLEPDDE